MFVVLIQSDINLRKKAGGGRKKTQSSKLFLIFRKINNYLKGSE